MSGTAKTTAALLAEEPDNTTGAILPQQMRNLAVSGPQWDVVSSAAAPGILRGTVELGDYVTRNGGTVGAGQVLATRQTNATQVQNAFNYAANNSKFLEFAPNTIEIDNVAGITTATSNFNSFRLYGEKGNSSLRQFHLGAPVLTLGPQNSTSLSDFVIDGLQVMYSGSSSTGNVLQLGYIYLSRVANIDVNGNFAVNNLIYAGDPANAGVFPFSNHFDNIAGSGANANFLACNMTSTGSKWTNIYFSNANPGATALSSAAINWGVGGAAPDETVFEQLNVEHAQVAIAMYVNGGNPSFIGCHWENIQLTGASPFFWVIAGGSETNINIIGGTTVDLGLNSGLMSGTATYFGMFDDVSISMIGHRFKTLGSPTVVRNMQLQMYSAPSNSQTPPVNVTRTACDINTTRFDSGYTGFMSLDSTLVRTTYGDLEWVDGYRGINAFPRIIGRAVVSATITPLSIYGALSSDIIVRYENTLTGTMTLVLTSTFVASGTGSTLTRPTNDQVTVIREIYAGGNFNVIVKNLTAGGSTLATFGATTLSAAITTTGATSISVTSATGFPSSGNYTIQIDSEQMLVTGGQGTTTWTVARGQNGTAAATHLISTVVNAGLSQVFAFNGTNWVTSF